MSPYEDVLKTPGPAPPKLSTCLRITWASCTQAGSVSAGLSGASGSASLSHP